MVELITVMAASVNGKVALWEVNPEHPDGEVYISGDGRSVQVAPTAAVQGKLRSGELIKVVTEQPKPDPEPIDGYSTLSAAKIIELAPTLTDEQKVAVLTYEAAHKNRSTVLEALQ